MSGKTELKIFDDHPPQVVIEAGYFEDIHPQTSMDDATNLEFVVPASNMDYLDLNDTLLSVRVKVVKAADGSTLDATKDKPVASNYFMHSLFSDVTLHLNDTVIEGGTQLYPYKAVMESELNFNGEAKKTQLLMAGLEETVASRKAWLAGSKVLELVGPLRLDFLNQPKYLLPGVSVRIRMTRANSNFSLTYAAGDTEPEDNIWKIVMEKAILYVRRVKVHPAIIKAHEFGLQTKNALYPYTRSKVITFTVPTGSTSYFKDNIFSSHLLPKVVIIGIVKGSGFSGTVKHRSLYFGNFGVNRVDLLRNGQSIPYRSGYQCDFDGELINDVYLRSIYQNMNSLNTNNGCGLTIKQFKDGAAFFVFNLTPDFDLNERQTVRDSNLRLDLSFKKALTEAINVIAYACYDATLQITKNREIIQDGFT